MVVLDAYHPMVVKKSDQLGKIRSQKFPLDLTWWSLVTFTTAVSLEGVKTYFQCDQ